VCKTPAVPNDATRDRILDVALEVLGRDPEAGMGEVATAAGVVRRTVYGHFPSRTDLVLTLARRAGGEVSEVLAAVDAPDAAPERAWASFVARLWPLARRYRLLLVLRRGEHGADIHAALDPVERALGDLVRRGQETGAFGRHLPAAVLGHLAFTTVFTLAESALTDGAVDTGTATVATLLVLGVPEARARELATA
jgi:AcrR family transcriptional regulator